MIGLPTMMAFVMMCCGLTLMWVSRHGARPVTERGARALARRADRRR
jgi:hypothetical protein